MAHSLKRDNWTTAEVLDLIRGRFIVSRSGRREESIGSYNDGVESVMHLFEDFDRPIEESGAMAYNPETREVVHVGPLPPR